MTNRRELLQSGLLALASIPAAAIATQRIRLGAEPLQLAVCDLRHEQSGRFGERARLRGVKVYSVGHDLTDLWVKRLWPAWRSQPNQGVIAGITGFDVLFCLELMAHDHGHRVVYRTHHRMDATEFAVHEDLSASSDAPLPARDWVDLQTERVLARASCAPRRHEAERCRAQGSAACLGRADLVSWVMAPTALLT